ncbi:helix-turn-helix transcriptional regulator [Nocardia sp. NPDC056064]|uniref:helix-turn-helix transcriptional regulator n=1 Tax=Nocardia sp. NPDC056064 TaxID=3345701 RepID=UPI0035E3A9F7
MDNNEVVVGGTTVSTAHVDDREAFDLWSSIMSEGIMPCAAEQLGAGTFYGALTPRLHSERVSITMVQNTPYLIRRRDSDITRAGASTVIATVPMIGVAEIASGDEYLSTPVGSMFIADGRRPQQSRTNRFQGLLITAPRDLVLAAAGIGDGEFPTVTVVEPTAHGRLIIDYFRRLISLPQTSFRTTALLDAGIDLLGAALAHRVDQMPTEPAADVYDRESVIAFLRLHLSDPQLNTEIVAKACRVSRRKLFRLLADIDGGPMALLRRMRIQQACQLLITAPDRTVGSVARACGFTGDRNFYRVFRSEVGVTPAEFRQRVATDLRTVN